MNYEDEIVQWSGYPKIASLPFIENINAELIQQQANIIKPNLGSII
jgi:dethiobiotin synthetase